MTLEEAEDSVLALNTLPQIVDSDITFTDDGGYVVSAGLEGRTISFSSHEAFQEFFGRTWPDSLLTQAILGQNDVPIPCTHELYIQWHVSDRNSPVRRVGRPARLTKLPVPGPIADARAWKLDALLMTFG